MSRVKISNILFLCSILCSCGLLDPYIDRRRNPGTGDINRLYTGNSKPDAPAICYNPFLSEEKELQTLADTECQKHGTGTHAEYIKTSGFSCKLFLPSINFYKCIK